MPPIKLYHYSVHQYDQLETLKYRGVKPSGARGNIPSVTLCGNTFNYTEHISFFLEPAPLDILGTVFGKDHPVWFPQNVLHEHVVDLCVSGPFTYHCVETPEKTALYLDDSIGDAAYYRELEKANKKNKYIGNTLLDFLVAQEHLKGLTREYYKLLPTRKNFDVYRNKYAPLVPHVMIYPDSGMMPVQSTRKVVVGNNPL